MEGGHQSAALYHRYLLQGTLFIHVFNVWALGIIGYNAVVLVACGLSRYDVSEI